ncbi:phosphatidylinositol N-acetylglucosaminyltransferase subunit P, putative [Hepatocystis sp. ex Piliocolobus tephrosceles]|nr:phosphatidylinositol N-acetylglucosaminyltransferase subunit P, putative [Hepatocystis sp. ex Piliocolobus tephrosceles]
MQSIKEGYAFFILYLSKILWVTYLIWAFAFDDFLSYLSFPFPSKYWAFTIPCGIVFTFICFILFTVIYSFIKTEPPNSIYLVEDEHSASNDIITEESINSMSDIKIEKINKLLYETNLYFD